MGLLDSLLSSSSAVGTGYGGGGESGGLSNLLQNKLFLQYLAGAGQDIGSGNAIGTNVNAITQQNIASQNYMKLLKKMLGPDETKGTFSNKGLTLSIPQSAISTGGAFLGENPLGIESTPSPVSNPKVGTASPFVGSQSDITASDLAGLSTADIGNVLSGAMSVEALKQKKVSDVIDTIYKLQQMKKSEAEIGKIERGDPLDQTFPIKDPFAGTVTNRQWNAMPDDEKRYAIYVHGANKTGQSLMSKEGFESMKPTEQIRTLKAYMDNPKLFDAALKLKVAGSTKISLEGKVKEKEALNEVERRDLVKKPDFAQKVTNDLMKNKIESQDPSGTDEFAKAHSITNEQAVEVLRRQMVRREMNSRIKQAYPDATWEKGKGWVVGDKVVVRDPYVK